MAPHIAVPADLAERFPALVVELRPRGLRGSVEITPGALSPADVVSLVAAFLLDTPRRSGFMLPGTEGDAVETVRPDYKGRSDCLLGKRFDLAVATAVERAVWWFGMEPTPLDRALVAAYGPGDHFSWHRDDLLPGTENRHTAVSIALNDPSEYEGGALEIPEAGLSIRPPLGCAVAFPASALHRVTPVSAGVRRVLLTFLLKEPT